MYIFSLSQGNHVYLFRQVRGITDDLLAFRSLSFRSHTICFTALIKLNLQTVGKFGKIIRKLAFDLSILELRAD